LADLVYTAEEVRGQGGDSTHRLNHLLLLLLPARTNISNSNLIIYSDFTAVNKTLNAFTGLDFLSSIDSSVSLAPSDLLLGTQF
jgi:hypothetical protein